MSGSEEEQTLTRREARKEDRREAILAVATRSFLERGYAATSMSSIAAELGGSKGTLWSYFPNKEELFAAVIEQRSNAFRLEIMELLTPSEDVQASLKSVSARFIRKLTSPDAVALNRLVMGEAARFPEIGQIFFQRAVGVTSNVISEYMRGAMVRGQLRDDDPVLAAKTFVALSVHSSQQRLFYGMANEITEDEIIADADRAIAIFMRAFGPV